MEGRETHTDRQREEGGPIPTEALVLTRWLAALRVQGRHALLTVCSIPRSSALLTDTHLLSSRFRIDPLLVYEDFLLLYLVAYTLSS